MNYPHLWKTIRKKGLDSAFLTSFTHQKNLKKLWKSFPHSHKNKIKKIELLYVFIYNIND